MHTSYVHLCVCTLDKFLCFTLVDNLGADLTTHQDTPVAKCKEDTYVVFNVDVHIQKTLDSLPPGMFEFFLLSLKFSTFEFINFK